MTVRSTLDAIKAQSVVHQQSLTIRALAVNDVTECDVMGRGQRAGHQLLSLTRDH